MGLGNLNPGCNCCESCRWFRDLFDRPDDTNLGADWTESSGAWSIVSETLRTSSSNAVALCNEAEPSASPDMDVEVRVYASNDNDIVQLRACDDGAGNSLAIELKFHSSCGHMKLLENGTQIGATIPIPDAVLNQWHRLSICYQEVGTSGSGTVSISLTTNVAGLGGNQYRLSISASASGTKVALATGAIAGEVRFDDFVANIIDPALNCVCHPYLTCEIGDDDFNRPDSTNIGCKWEEVVGNFEIQSGKLVPITAGSIAKFGYSQPYGESAQVVEVQVTLTAIGDTGRVIVDYVDANNYHCFQSEKNSTNQNNIKLIKVSGGAESVLVSGHCIFSGGNLKVCLSEDRIVGQIASAGSVACEVAAPTTPHGGLFSGVSAPVIADHVDFQFFFYRLGISENSPDCYDCLELETCAACISGNAKSLYKVTLSGWTNGDEFVNPCSTCSDIDGTYIIPVDGCGGTYYGSICGRELQISLGFQYDQPNNQGIIEVFVRIYNCPDDAGDEYDYVQYWKGGIGGGKVDCENLNNVDIPRLGFPYACGQSGHVCDGGATTCTVTAI